jgi:hypothetical protein
MLVGCASVSASPELLRLKYIAVVPEARRRGVAKALLRYAIERLWFQQATIELDVFIDNQVARNWYTAIGFRSTAALSYWEIELLETEDAPTMYIGDWPQAEVCQDIFGFSTFLLVTGCKQTRVGRIGERWFYIASADVIEDPEVRRALYNVDANRRAYSIVEDDSVSQWMKSNGRRTHQTLRMGAQVSSLLQHLKEIS